MLGSVFFVVVVVNNTLSIMSKVYIERIVEMLMAELTSTYPDRGKSFLKG